MDNISDVVKAAIQTQILAAFNQGPDLIEKLVEAALKEPVKDGPYSYNSKPYLDHLVGNCVRDAAREAVTEVFSIHKDAIRAAVRERFSADTIVNSFADALIKASGEEWRINVNFEAEKSR
ncbi:hypothetical protein SAMN03159423_0209 [Bradyrhizobium sp. NFR13]|uniref:hypothetical protein n=1 Tax=Bradyrhizobium sp. NFR13 TaxID=1566285 RepID=UPI0008E29802|nr:hypothetical protein [Bradyrhizobium sp. NFR13]SFM24559.1 hypothetical protein SAMN03159423_0209 [Bradyrhizobium sp. NFR13]